MKYEHKFENRKVVMVNLYPNSILYDFINRFNTVWSPHKATSYFYKRDEKAIPYLQKVILISGISYSDPLSEFVNAIAKIAKSSK